MFEASVGEVFGSSLHPLFESPTILWLEGVEWHTRTARACVGSVVVANAPGEWQTGLGELARSSHMVDGPRGARTELVIRSSKRGVKDVCFKAPIAV